jgi:hypothetical protein
VNWKRIVVNGIAALVVPFVMEAIWIAAGYRVGPSFPGYGSFLSQVVCVTVGALLLPRHSPWAVLAVFVYVPLMFAALVGFTVVWSCGRYGNCL